MHILVTGGLGFIGSNFVRHVLRAREWSITNLDLQTYAGNPANLRDCETDPRYRFVRGDIADPATVQPLMDAADVVVHFAAETHVDRSIHDGQAFVRTNVVGTQVLLEAARRAGVRCFCHVGTDEVYGSIEAGASIETDALLPNSPYAASKAAADLLVRAYHATHGVPAIVTRCSNNFGPYQFPEKAIPLLITNAMEDKPFPLYGDGRQVRDWLYVEDHADALVFLLEHGRPGEIYNIGGTCALPNHELVAKILDGMGKPRALIRRVPDRPAHDRRYAVNCDKLRALGWRPRTQFEAALRDTIHWYEQHAEWWRPLKGEEMFTRYYERQYAARLAEGSQ
ncbi:MAG: dTDP-glucose 4,6-dehydratase [Deltaproteobacteria bacterium]|nr:dTDP-glucose 4,6-dehydratase [Deltaproteobacteria bacterium]